MLEISNDVNIVNKVKKMKAMNIFAWILSLGIPLVLVIIMFSLLIAQIFFNLGISSVIVPTMNLFVQGNLWYGRHHRKKLDQELNDFARAVSEKTDTKYRIHDLKEFEIIPKNLKLGEDLSHKNIVEIFQKGHYVLVHAYPNDIVIRQYVDDDHELHVDLLQDEEKEAALVDIYSEPKELDGVKRLSLQNKESR